MGFFLALFGIANVEVTEFALNYSLLTRKVEKRTYYSGRYWIGPFNYFVKFPAVVKTIQFSDSKLQADLPITERSDGLLRSRTKDGLDVNIEVSFQYQLQPALIYELYTQFGDFYVTHNIFVRVAIDRLTESATTFTATEFFNERTEIGKDMEAQLAQDFKDRLYSKIFSFQLRAVGLPQPFEEAIQETEVMKQDVQVATAEQQSAVVAYQTELMQAKRRIEVVANQGEASAESVLLANGADIAQYTAMQERSADSYAGILKELDSSPTDLLAYMEARTIRDHPSDKTTVGLGLPAASASA